jgi:hypothetical protein
MYVSRNGQVQSRDHCCREKAISITHSVYVYIYILYMCVCVCVCVSVALVIQHAKRMCCIILCSVACQLYNTFPHYLINGRIFEKKGY